MARVAVSRPGRRPARVNSFARRAEAILLARFGGVWALAMVPRRMKTKGACLRGRRAARPSPLRQYRIQSRLKIFLTLARQFTPLDRQGRFDRLDPAK